jgi:hypothetical protein
MVYITCMLHVGGCMVYITCMLHVGGCMVYITCMLHVRVECCPQRTTSTYIHHCTQRTTCTYIHQNRRAKMQRHTSTKPRASRASGRVPWLHSKPMRRKEHMCAQLHADAPTRAHEPEERHCRKLRAERPGLMQVYAQGACARIRARLIAACSAAEARKLCGGRARRVLRDTRVPGAVGAGDVTGKSTS